MLGRAGLRACQRQGGPLTPPRRATQNPDVVAVLPDGRITANMDMVEKQRYFEEFYEDVFLELNNVYGEVDEMQVSCRAPRGVPSAG